MKETLSPGERGAARGHRVPPPAAETAAQSSERGTLSSEVLPAKGLVLITPPLLCRIAQVAA